MTDHATGILDAFRAPSASTSATISCDLLVSFRHHLLRLLADLIGAANRGPEQRVECRALFGKCCGNHTAATPRTMPGSNAASKAAATIPTTATVATVATISLLFSLS